jgi:release factor glutamine methyltransferase
MADTPKTGSEQVRTWRVLDLIEWTTEYFGRQRVDTPRLDAELLLAHALRTNRMGLYLDLHRVVNGPQLALYRTLVRRRRERVPVAYLVGQKEFYGLSFAVAPDVLIPRPETEVLVETALDRLRQWPADAQVRVLDVGTGCGAIAVALARSLVGRPLRVVATDISAAALVIAEANAVTAGVAGIVEFRHGDLLEPVRHDETFHVIAANLPYVPTADIGALEPEVSRHEPRLALDGGADGLACVARLARDAGRALTERGWLCLEVGQGQAARVSSLLTDAGGYSVPEVVCDYGGVERVVAARRR